MKRRIRYKRKEHRGVDLKQRIKEYPQKMFEKSGAQRNVIKKNTQQRRTETKNDKDVGACFSCVDGKPEHDGGG